jgi:integrase
MKTVRRTLADGTVKEYRYPRHRRGGPARIGALRRIFNAYSVSPEFRAAGPAWCQRRLWLYNLIEAELGWMTQADLEAPAARKKFYALRDLHAALPTRADYLMIALGGALAWAYDRGDIGYNHAQGIKRLYDAGASPHQDKCLGLDQEAEILAALDPALADVYRLAVLTGLRRVDCTLLDADRHVVRHGPGPDLWLDVVPKKTARRKIRVILPLAELPALRDLVERLRRQHATGPLLRHPATGARWNADVLSREWHAAMTRLGLDGWRFQDIRHTANTRLAEAGCTDAERHAVMGRKLAKGSEGVYIARVRSLAVNAFRKYRAWLESQQPGQIIPLENAARKTP